MSGKNTPFIFICLFIAMCSLTDIAFAKKSVEKKSAEKPAPEDLTCVNGANPKNDEVYKSFIKSDEPLKKAFSLQYKEHQNAAPKCPVFKREAQTSLENLNQEIKKSDPPMLQFYAEGEARPKLILNSCIQSALERDPNNDRWTCSGKDYNTPKKVSETGKQCYTQEMLDYTQYAVNAAITCLSAGRDPIDARVIYQKYNNESAFDYSISYDGGKGIAQITGWPVRELTDRNDGRGRPILEEFTKNNSTLCEPFKTIAAQDLKKPPGVSNRNPCDYVSTGEGIARTLLYSLGYYIFNRDEVVGPYLFSLSPKVAANKEVANALAAVAYGAEGWNKARELIDGFRVGPKTDPAKFLKYVQKNSRYLRSISDKMGEAYCLKHGLEVGTKKCNALRNNMPAAELNGDTCVK